VAELVQIIVDFWVVEIGARRPDLPHHALTELSLLDRADRGLRFVAEVGQRLRARGRGPAGGAERLHRGTAATQAATIRRGR
jgi:hypothetical protein